MNAVYIHYHRPMPIGLLITLAPVLFPLIAFGFTLALALDAFRLLLRAVRRG